MTTDTPADSGAGGTGALADFLLPEGYDRPRPVAVLRETRLVGEAGRAAWDTLGVPRCRRRAYAAGAVAEEDPVLLVPGFLAGDGSLALMARSLRRHGLRTYRSHIHVNAGCTREAADLLEERLESISRRRGSRVRIVGHSLGGMLGRGVAARRPDLVSGLVTMGSPVLAPGAHHVGLAASVGMLVRLSRAGWPGLMSDDCVSGDCARTSFGRTREPLADGVPFTAVYSRRDGIVDWRACLDPLARHVEVTASHVGMAVDPRVVAAVVSALRPDSGAASEEGSVVEVDEGEIA